MINQIKRVVILVFITTSLCALGAVTYAATQTPSKRQAKRIEEVAPEINPKVLKLALHAQEKAEEEGIADSRYLTVIDFSKPSSEKRLWVLDLEKNEVKYHTYVAHGKASGDNYPTSFSNEPESHKSSIGVFKTGKTYIGKHGLALNLHGLEKGINDKAFDRRVVIHSSAYATEAFIKAHGRLGRSFGCPALDPKVSKGIIKLIKGGSLLFSYYPDSKWMKQSKFI